MARLPRKNQGDDGDVDGGGNEVEVADAEESADDDYAEAPSTPTTWYEPLSSLAPPSAEEREKEHQIQNQQQRDLQNKDQQQPTPPKDRPVRVYADGIYDLFHFGHARALEQAKKLFPNTYLLVGCCNDEITHMYKGKTVMTEAERYESLRHCKWVDEVIPDAPWVLNQEFIDKHNIDYVAHDALPYADASGAGNDVYEFVKAIGKFKETRRTDGVSTSDIIMRILKDYNEYVMRNLARGYSRKDLGVSYVKEKQLRVNMGITKLREKVKEHQENVGKKLHTVAKTAGMHHNEWVENADRWIAGFLEKFEEGCHIMETAIKDKIQEGLKRQQSKSRNSLLEEAETGEASTTPYHDTEL